MKFGLKYLRFLSISVVITIHSLVWLIQSGGMDFSEGFGDKPLIGLLSLMTPASAGAIFRASLERDLVGGRLVGLSVSKAGSLFLFLALIESFKGALVGGLPGFFGWNVLHLAGLSFFVLVLISRLSTALVPLAGALVIALAPLIRESLAPMQLVTLSQVFHLYHSGFGVFWLVTLASWGFILLLWTLARAGIPRRWFKVAVMSAVTILFAWTLRRIVWPSAGGDGGAVMMVARLYNLPTAILIGDPHGFHIWPFFPWFGVIAYGFAVYDGFIRFGRSIRYRLVLGACSTLLLGWYLATYPEEYRQAISVSTLWSPQIFQAATTLVAGVLGAFGINVLLCELLERHADFRAFDFMTVFGRSILWIYLFVTSAGIWLGRLFASHVPFGISRFAFPLFMHAASYALGLAVVRLLGRKTLRVKVSAV